MTIDYGKLLDRQRNWFATGRTKEIEFRIESLKLLKQTIINRADEIMFALEKDFGKSRFETFSSEIMITIEEINLAIKNLNSWAAPLKVKTPLIYFKAKSRIYYEPFGIVLVISAWNYPFQLTINPLIGAIAAGNCCVVKPSELSPHTSIIVASIIKESFPEEYCAAVEGGIDETTALLNEEFDFIHYTGSTRVGRIIAQAAAKHLTPVVLEMGGKSPCIVDNTADLKISARRIVWGKFLNAGQTCVAPDYLITHKAIKTPLLQAIKEQIKAFYGDTPEKSGDYCRIISQKHFDRLSAFLKKGTIINGGNTDPDQLYIEPTLLDNISWDDPVMQEEIFGPILPVLEYEDLSQAIAMVNAHSKPLALYFFSKDKKAQQRLIKEVPFGGGCINATLMHTANPHLPFGGVGESGIGSYHGRWSFETFSHKKSVLDKSTLIDPSLPYPPYKNKVNLLRGLYK